MRASVLAAVLALAMPAAALAQPATYDIRWAGVRIATATINTTLDDGRYAMTLEARYRLLIWSGTVAGRVEGNVSGGRVAPRSVAIRSSGSPENAAELAFEGGAARVVRLEPPLPPNWNEGRVPLRPEHQRGVLDPLSAVLQMAVLAATAPDGMCGRTLPVFTGTTRVDIGTSAAPVPVTRASSRAAAEPAPGPACNLRFTPVAGHRPVNATIRALQAASGMRAEFEAAAVGGVRPLRLLRIPTSYGTLSIERRAG
jgi:hypothetical protein